MTMTSLFEQTGWKRPYPKMLCQDWSILNRIYFFSYDLSNLDFLDYLKSRGIICISKEPERLEKAIATYGPESKSGDKCIIMMKQKIEDAWFLFKCEIA